MLFRFVIRPAALIPPFHLYLHYYWPVYSSDSIKTYEICACHRPINCTLFPFHRRFFLSVFFYVKIQFLWRRRVSRVFVLLQDLFDFNLNLLFFKVKSALFPSNDCDSIKSQVLPKCLN